MADTQSTNSGQISCRTPPLADVVSTQIDLEKLPTDNHFPEGGTNGLVDGPRRFFSVFCSFGWANAIGVVQDYYETHQLKHLSSSTIGWIASLQLFFFVGRLFDVAGPRYLFIIGTVLEVLGLMMTSICSKYGEFLVCQGIITPIGAAFIFYTALAAVPTHFHRKRGLAMGLSSSGSSLGGTIFPIMVKKLSQTISYGWTMRACAFLILGLLVMLVLLLRPMQHTKDSKKFASMTTRSILQIVLVVASMLTFWGLFIPIDFVTTAARHYNISDDMATYLISILNGASVVSRIVTGYIDDHAGRHNVNTIGILTAGILTLAMWIPSTKLAQLIVYSVIYGFASVQSFLSVQHAARRFRNFAALIGIPIAGAIIGDGSKQARWQGMMAFAGELIVLGSALQWCGRVMKVGWSLRKIF
ncbi:major facilitator superfamily domain-containing protein [Lipomyces mesembrius]